MSNQEEHLKQGAIHILRAFGKDEESFLLNTPKRFTDFFLQSNGTSPEELLNSAIIKGEKYEGMVIEQGLPFYSLCEHHLLPFFGTANIAYIPNERLVGLSKIPRLLNLLATRPNLQERITQTLADLLDKYLEPKGVYVVLKATHLCMCARGARVDQSSQTVTSVPTGLFLQVGSTARMEFLALTEGK